MTYYYGYSRDREVESYEEPEFETRPSIAYNETDYDYYSSYDSDFEMPEFYSYDSYPYYGDYDDIYFDSYDYSSLDMYYLSEDDWETQWEQEIMAFEDQWNEDYYESFNDSWDEQYYMYYDDEYEYVALASYDEWDYQYYDDYYGYYYSGEFDYYNY